MINVIRVIIFCMVKQQLIDKVRNRIKKRGEIKSSGIYNAFRRVGGTEVSDRTIAKAIKHLDDNDYIKRKRDGQDWTCIWIGEEEESDSN